MGGVLIVPRAAEAMRINKINWCSQQSIRGEEDYLAIRAGHLGFHFLERIIAAEKGIHSSSSKWR